MRTRAMRALRVRASRPRRPRSSRRRSRPQSFVGGPFGRRSLTRRDRARPGNISGRAAIIAIVPKVIARKATA